eukprot:m51a1_g5461 hypothetical protein (115) ;mRNA; f:246899-247243
MYCRQHRRDPGGDDWDPFYNPGAPPLPLGPSVPACAAAGGSCAAPAAVATAAAATAHAQQRPLPMPPARAALAPIVKHRPPSAPTKQPPPSPASPRRLLPLVASEGSYEPVETD